MPIRLLLCLLLAVAVDGSLRRHHALKKLHKNSVGNIRPWSQFHAWHNFRNEPWFLRWPELWRLRSAAKDINVTSIKRRRRWNRFRTRRSKWSQLYSKLYKHDLDRIPKENPILSWPNSIDQLASDYDFSKTLKSASHYAKPSWLQRLRNSRKENVVDSLETPTEYNDANGQFAKISTVKWDERRGESKSGYLKTIQPLEEEFLKAPVFSGRSIRPTGHKDSRTHNGGEDDSTSGEEWSGVPVDTPLSNSKNPLWHGDLDKVVKLEIVKEFDPYKSPDEHGFYTSGEISEDVPTQRGNERKQAKSSLTPHLHHEEDRGDIGPMADMNSGMFSGEDQGYSSGGNTFGKDLSSASKTSGDSSVEHGQEDSLKPTFEETLQPMERSTGDNFGHDFESFEPLAPGSEDYYSTYMDFDESGFGSFGEYGPFDEGSFLKEDDCDSIETRACKDDSQCNCMGMYFCVAGTCSTVSTSSNDQELPPEMSGIWHETPMSE